MAANITTHYIAKIAKKYKDYKPISGRVDRASVPETADSGSIPSRIKPKTIKIDIHSFPA